MTTDRELLEHFNALTLENKVKVLASNLPQELGKNWAKELAVKWDELTPEEKAKFLVATLPKELLEHFNALTLEEKAKFLAGNLPTSTVKSTITQNQIETTIRLLKEKASIAYISQVTGLTKGQINAFKGC